MRTVGARHQRTRPPAATCWRRARMASISRPCTMSRCQRSWRNCATPKASGRARWQEFDPERAVWTRPGAHMKNGVEHRIPLSPRAVEILRALPRYSDFVFPGRSGGQASSAMLRRQLARMKCAVDPHGFRAAFKTWAGEQTGYPYELIEVALAHSLGALDEAYRRADMLARRRQLMEAWSEYCSRPDAV